MSANPAILISNSFPYALIRRRVVVEPSSVPEMIAAMQERPWESVWGHANTVALAGGILGQDIRPKSERPAITLTDDLLPQLGGISFNECWLLNPDYQPGFRPASGVAVKPEQIRDWQVLKLAWDMKDAKR